MRLADLSAPQLLVVSFMFLIAAGWLGFLVLPGLYEGAPMGWVDALFISASAVCVTGLSTIDVPVVLSFWGELWLLLLIQAGGLGILTFAAMVARVTGRRAGIDVEEASGTFTSVMALGTPGSLMRTILGVTLACEAVGALGLLAVWGGDHELGRAVWLAVFHSVSAFCNAGFSLFSDSLMGQRGDAPILLLIAGLIALGGIGFPVLHDLRSRLRGKQRLSTHSRLTLAMTGFLILFGGVAFLYLEWDRQLAGLGLLDRIVNALFMSITPRTAGFNAVDYGAVTNGSILLTCVLMWIGGAPGSTAGGAKVTTVALLALLVFARLRGDRHVSVAGRTIPDETVHRATGLAAGMVLILL
ncbi:potassium transporter TrkH, partial [Myxococcota bacterium]|nr:potassium transporter TrkH [Myxococcota bacterium]